MREFVLISSIVFAPFILGGCTRQEFKSPESFFLLYGKSQAEIESVYGKPEKTELAEYSGNSIYHYRVSEEARLEVQYSDGKAVSFYFDIPYEWQVRNPEETLKRCNLNLQPADAEQDIHGLSWRDKTDDKLNSIIRINRFGDGPFYNCEAHFLPE